jgi:hypothetical protein
MLAPAPYNDCEYGEGVMQFSRQQIKGYSTVMRMHRGTKYALPCHSGEGWKGWIENYGDVSYEASSQTEAEQACIRQIERFIKSSKHGVFATRAI